MPFYLATFDGVTLPRVATRHPEGTAPTIDTTLPTINGCHDTYGTQRAPATWPVTEQWQAELVGASASAVETALRTLRAKRGVVGALTRTTFDTVAVSEACSARLMHIAAPRTATDITALPLTLIFARLSPWRAATADAITTPLTAGTPIGVTCENWGSADVTDAVISVTARVADITNLIIANTATGVTLTFSGVIQVDTTLVIDCGAASVLNNGADAWADLTLSATGDDSDDWLRLPAGQSATMTVTPTGGGYTSSITFAYSQQWE